jgi:acyl-CoA reductase-like NAD-dependent aldehyde dehydrogenase
MAEARKVGDPFADGIQQGPQIDERQFKKIEDFIASGKKEGATCVTGGGKGESVFVLVFPVSNWYLENRHSFDLFLSFLKGYYIQPTGFSDVQDNMRIAQEEIFGPVQSIFKFTDINEAIERANATKYGLAAGIMTNDINKALLFAQSVQAGSVW